MPTVNLPSERQLTFRRRQLIIYLLGCTAMAVGTIIAVLTQGENPEMLIPTVGFFALFIAVGLVTRVRWRSDYAREEKRIWSDEWILRGLQRSSRNAYITMIFAQPALALFMAYVPPEPSVAGMAMMTIALGCGTWAASYLYHTRANPDE